MAKEDQRRLRERRRAAGECVPCGKPSGGKYRCPKCAAEHAEAEKRSRARKRGEARERRESTLDLMLPHVGREYEELEDPTVQIFACTAQTLLGRPWAEISAEDLRVLASIRGRLGS